MEAFHIIRQPVGMSSSLARNLRALVDAYPDGDLVQTIVNQAHDVSNNMQGWVSNLEQIRDGGVDDVDAYFDALKTLNTHCKRIIRAYAENKLTKDFARLYWEYVVNSNLQLIEISNDIDLGAFDAN